VANSKALEELDKLGLLYFEIVVRFAMDRSRRSRNFPETAASAMAARFESQPAAGCRATEKSLSMQKIHFTHK
jgi:hypothetical protein